MASNGEETYTLNYKGSITVICGPMYAGKTSELLRRARNARYAKKKVKIIKPKIDTRHNSDIVTTHDNINMDATSYELISESFKDILSYDVIAVEEGQLFSDLSISCDMLANMGKKVIISMLNGTYDRTFFPYSDSSNIFCIADDIIMLKAVCTLCGNEAIYSHLKNRKMLEKQKLLDSFIAIETIHNQSLSEETTRSDIQYEPLCRECFFKQ